MTPVDVQFDFTIDGKAIKIASMLDEHTQCSLPHLVERSITAERLVAKLEKAFAAAGGRPRVLRMDNGPELVSQALQRFCDGKVGLCYIPLGTRGTTVTSNRSTAASARSASTATTGSPYSRPEWSSATSSTSTTTATGTRPWVTEPRPSALQRAGTISTAGHSIDAAIVLLATFASLNALSSLASMLRNAVRPVEVFSSELKIPCTDPAPCSVNTLAV